MRTENEGLVNALVVVAHFDDAVLWMGGTIRRLRDWNWHIIGMCLDSSQKKEGFVASCCMLGAKPSVMDFEDNQEEEKNPADDMKSEILKAAGDNKYDYVFTHSRRDGGEYGYDTNHANHKEVWKVVRSLVGEGQLVTDVARLAYFCYQPIYRLEKLGTVAKCDANYYYQLTYQELAFKACLIRSFDAGTVKNLEDDLGAPCPNPEAFEGDGLSLPDPFKKRKKDSQ